jgi:hypothetical protein
MHSAAGGRSVPRRPAYVRAALISPVLVPATKRTSNDDPLTQSHTTVIRTEVGRQVRPVAAGALFSQPRGPRKSRLRPRSCHAITPMMVVTLMANSTMSATSRPRADAMVTVSTPHLSQVIRQSLRSARTQSHGRVRGGKISVSDLRRVSPALGLMSGVSVGRIGRELRALKSRPGGRRDVSGAECYSPQGKVVETESHTLLSVENTSLPGASGRSLPSMYFRATSACPKDFASPTA